MPSMSFQILRIFSIIYFWLFLRKTWTLQTLMGISSLNYKEIKWLWHCWCTILTQKLTHGQGKNICHSKSLTSGRMRNSDGTAHFLCFCIVFCRNTNQTLKKMMLQLTISLDSLLFTFHQCFELVNSVKTKTSSYYSLICK